MYLIIMSYRDEWSWTLLLQLGDLLWSFKQDQFLGSNPPSWKAVDENERLLLRTGGPELEPGLWLPDVCFRALENKPLGLLLLFSVLSLFNPDSNGFSQWTCLSVAGWGFELLFPPLGAEDLKKNSFFICQSSIDRWL